MLVYCTLFTLVLFPRSSSNQLISHSIYTCKYVKISRIICTINKIGNTWMWNDCHVRSTDFIFTRQKAQAVTLKRRRYPCTAQYCKTWEYQHNQLCAVEFISRHSRTDVIQSLTATIFFFLLERPKRIGRIAALSCQNIEAP